jgi:hypothetical protein
MKNVRIKNYLLLNAPGGQWGRHEKLNIYPVRTAQGRRLENLKQKSNNLKGREKINLSVKITTCNMVPGIFLPWKYFMRIWLCAVTQRAI